MNRKQKRRQKRLRRMKNIEKFLKGERNSCYCSNAFKAGTAAYMNWPHEKPHWKDQSK
jgi:hypothetical protein